MVALLLIAVCVILGQKTPPTTNFTTYNLSSAQNRPKLGTTLFACSKKENENKKRWISQDLLSRN